MFSLENDKALGHDGFGAHLEFFLRAGILGHQKFLCYWLAYLFTYLDDKKPLQVRALSCTHPCQVNPKYTTLPQEPFIE